MQEPGERLTGRRSGRSVPAALPFVASWRLQSAIPLPFSGGTASTRLLVPQGLDRVEAARAPRGEQAGDHADEARDDEGDQRRDDRERRLPLRLPAQDDDAEVAEPD